MITKEIFSKKTSKKINESMSKTFGKKIKLETFSIEQLEDSRNKLRTQIHQFKSNSTFNENLENETYHQAQWMLDAINAELAEREEQVLERDDLPNEVARELFDQGVRYGVEDEKEIIQMMSDMGYGKYMNHPDFIGDVLDDLAAMEDENDDFDFRQEYDDDPMDDMMDSIENNNEVVAEGEVQQASAIVTANTMVDRVDRWIDELSGMENETLLQLGDTIRDEMGHNEAKQFIETVSPEIETALDTLKKTRMELHRAVLVLSGEEQPTDMLGSDDEEMEEPTNDKGPLDLDELEDDDFETSEPATGGQDAEGRAQRESKEYSSRLLGILAG